MTDHTVRLSLRDQIAVEYAAAEAGTTIQALLETWIARRAATLPLPPGPRRPKTVVLEQRVLDRTAAGEPTTEIAAVYGIDPDHVRRIRAGHTTTTDRSTRP